MTDTHYTYLISSTNPKTAAKYYIGVRTAPCRPENDSYLGSSIHLKFDIEAFGQLSFEKIIIKEYNTRAEANKGEAILLAEHNARYSSLFYNRGKIALIRKQFTIDESPPAPQITKQKPRPFCKCGNLTAINYKKNGKTYYRKKCHACAQLAKQPKANWEISGYIKQVSCDKCGFRSKLADQISVIKVGMKFKSVCLNCEADIKVNGWKTGDLMPDF